MTPRNSEVQSSPARPLRVAIDIGGTFTDIVVVDVDRDELRFDKVETTPADPALGVFHALARLGIAMADVDCFIHGTTLGINALMTRTGARVAVVSTADARGARRAHAELVPRGLVFEVPEVVRSDGTVKLPLDRSVAQTVALAIRRAGVDAVAVCFLHSDANPAHEAEMGAFLAAELPGVDITLSHRLVAFPPSERASTAVLNAYIKPSVCGYLDRLSAGLGERGFRGRFLTTRAGGGLITVATAKGSPVHLILSGLAGGVIGGAAFASIAKEPNLITLDMGGTRLDVSTIAGGIPVMSADGSIAGVPFFLPHFSIEMIGAGGGWIGWADDVGRLQVGPQSVVADPGPASYGKGGQHATLTDAALVVGYLGESTALGGALALDRRLAIDALAPLAETIGLPTNLVAVRMLEIATTRIVGVIRDMIVDRGRPRDFAILAFGGGGGLVAADVARQLGVPRVIVPPGPGAFSALGMVMAAVEDDMSRTPARGVRGRRALLRRGPLLAVAEREGMDPERALMGLRVVLSTGHSRVQRYRVYARALLQRDTEVAGPAILEENTATTVVHKGDRIKVGAHGELVITIGAGR